MLSRGRYGARKRRLQIGVRFLTGVDLNSVKPIEGKKKQGLDSTGSMRVNADLGCKQGLLGAYATIKILISHG